MANWWTGKGYGISTVTDLNGRPLLTFQGPNDKKPYLLSDRVAQVFDFTIKQNLQPGDMKNDRMDPAVSTFIKTQMGGVLDDELDHKISLELGGSNTPANLMIQPGRTAGASAASDTLENNLALDVVAGRISLLDSWRTLADQKGFLLGEDTKLGTTFSFTQAMGTLFGTVLAAAQGKLAVGLGQDNAILKAQIASDIEKMKANGLNQPALTSIFANQVEMVKQKLNVSQSEAASTTKTYIGAYAESKGIDPREMMSAMNTNIQQILENSKASPNIYGVSSSALSKMAAALAAASGVAIGLGVILAIIGIVTIGPEAAIAAFTGGIFEGIASAFGVSATLGIGVGMVEIGGALTVISFALNMAVKEVYDNGYLNPTQNITAMKDALAIQKGLAGFLPSLQKTATVTTTTPTTSTGASSTISTKVFTGIVSQGTIGNATPFVSRESDIISNTADLTAAATNNLAVFMTSLPGRVKYEIKVVSRVVTKDGTVRVGTVQQVKIGVTAKGVARYKTVHNKFAEVTVYVVNDKGTRTKIETIILGPVNSLTFNPNLQALNDLANNIQGTLVTSNVSAISGITTPNPITVTTPQTTATTTTKVTTPTGTITVNIPTPTTQSTPVTVTTTPSVAVAVPQAGTFASRSDGALVYTSKATGFNLAMFPNMASSVEGVRQSLPTFKSQGQLVQIDVDTISAKLGLAVTTQATTNTNGLYQVERSTTALGYEIIFYPPGQTPDASLRYPGTAAPTASFPIPPSNNPNRKTATTIATYFDVNGASYPNITMRGKLWESFGFGPAAYYTGTAEQNTKLLAALKAS